MSSGSATTAFGFLRSDGRRSLMEPGKGSERLRCTRFVGFSTGGMLCDASASLDRHSQRGLSTPHARNCRTWQVQGPCLGRRPSMVRTKKCIRLKLKYNYLIIIYNQFCDGLERNWRYFCSLNFVTFCRFSENGPKRGEILMV